MFPGGCWVKIPETGMFVIMNFIKTTILISDIIKNIYSILKIIIIVIYFEYSLSLEEAMFWQFVL